ncbi:3-hydroxyacyl-ACP dehydratase FabZ [Candidatus Purcelliella pentastirinorum]|uniref:3-hydroxyacyl-ACP dehydratase FabZ n=1 Tax=Candidatus Purcelliella pentastirinorum TaxID=472834 RepID=UPI000E279701|nr:3-hydroxyacyl-ACP dehydratase FabZ [Candidatus Purcelliella pentastirinorum]WDI79010.1 3-hydroxyacyl-ACP dehydratase FabZ [Candidatus Purcelliella pentastirinorum]WDR80147.1 3-hydroxyacyl-ACP dehydratase FabZ [Candidatus Purcelliella pentastirinorum]
MSTKIHNLSIEEILKLLPHRYPFLLIDRIIYIIPHISLKGIKNISFNEPFFQGHFPNKKIFPGVLILEAMAQATGILAFKSLGELKIGELYYFAGVDNARFKYPVVPGDQLIIKVYFDKTRCGLTKFKGIAYVKNKIVCEADIMCSRGK